MDPHSLRYCSLQQCIYSFTKTGVLKLIPLSLSAAYSHGVDFHLYFLDKQTSSELSRSMCEVPVNSNLQMIFISIVQYIYPCMWQRAYLCKSHCNHRTQKTKKTILKAAREENYYFQRTDNWSSSWPPNTNNGSQKILEKDVINVLKENT